MTKKKKKSKTYIRFQPEKGIHGPFALTDEQIDEIDDEWFGVYLLGVTSNKGNIVVKRVGRGNLKERLTKHKATGRYSYFYFKFLSNDTDAFFEECRLFHAYDGPEHLDNRNHPDRPDGVDEDFPSCLILDCDGC